MIIKMGKLKFSFDKSWGKIEEMEKMKSLGKTGSGKILLSQKYVLLKVDEMPNAFMSIPHQLISVPFLSLSLT
jgi:hypothetical protein